MKTSYYYTLIVREAGLDWYPQFGDYDKEVVKQELEDTREDWGEGAEFKIIKTEDAQESIDKKVKEFNEK